MSISDAYDQNDGLGLASLVAKGDLTAAELLDEASRRCDERNPQLNAIVTTFFDAARDEVTAGLPEGPFRGVPYPIKDLKAAVAGVVTSDGSRLFADAVAEGDSELVARYRRAGLVLFGKTNTPEFGLNCSTEPLLHGPTRNPWDPARTAGGSSGGAAAATAAGIVPLAHATDGGGSIRIPASCCGLFGLKPTRARTPLGPSVGEGWSGMSHAHAVTRSVRDSAALLDATCGPASGDPYAAPTPSQPFLSEVGSDPGRLRIAVCTSLHSDFEPDPECVEAVESTAALCRELGHEVVEGRPSYDPAVLGRATQVLIGANIALVVDERAEALGRELREDDLELTTRLMVERARKGAAVDYARAIRDMHQQARRVAAFFETCDLLLTPTLGSVPVPLGTIDMNADPAAFGRGAARFTHFLGLFNATGQPAMSVPLHWTAGGLPVGSHFVGRFGDEATLFRLASQLEQARPWFDRRPPGV